MYKLQRLFINQAIRNLHKKTKRKMEIVEINKEHIESVDPIYRYDLIQAHQEWMERQRESDKRTAYLQQKKIYNMWDSWKRIGTRHIALIDGDVINVTLYFTKNGEVHHTFYSYER